MVTESVHFLEKRLHIYFQDCTLERNQSHFSAQEQSSDSSRDRIYTVCRITHEAIRSSSESVTFQSLEPHYHRRARVLLHFYFRNESDFSRRERRRGKRIYNTSRAPYLSILYTSRETIG